VFTIPAVNTDFQKTPDSSAPLKIGVLLDSTDAPAWAYHMLQTIKQGDYAHIAVLIIDAGPQPPYPQSTTSTWQRTLKKSFHRLSHGCYQRFIARDDGKEDALRPCSIPALLPDASIFETRTLKSVHIDRLPQADVEEIKAHNLDVILRVGFRILHGDILTAAKHGVWSIMTSDNRVLRGAPACFWETMQSWPVLGSGLQILTEELDNGCVLYRSYSETDRFSIENNVRKLYWKSQAYMPRMLKRLHAEGDALYQQLHLHTEHEPFQPSPPPQMHPGTAAYAILVLKKSLEKIHWIAHNKLNLRQWGLMQHANDNPHTNPWHYHRIWADPFLLQRNNRNYLFMEELYLNENKGRIAVAEINSEGLLGEPKVILDAEHHLSYPHVFEHDGETWMLPECSASEKLSLYRCTSFPDQWEFVMHLMEGIKVVDATLHWQDGLWWLFANTAENTSMDKHDELNIYYAKDFRTTAWNAHRLNPVVSDVRTARPGGNLFYHQGKLIRPSQNCSHHYGYGYNLNEVHTLTPTQYREYPIRTVTPTWRTDIVSTHSYNSVPGLSVIDAQVVRPRYY